MKYHRRLTAALLVLALAAALFAGCGPRYRTVEGDTQSYQTSVTVGTDTLRLPIDVEDTLNPFTSKTNANRALISLVYEPLFRTDDAFLARPAAAESYTTENKTMTVKLDMNAAFSDGTQISAQDVLYSFEKAKESAAYKNELTHITAAKRADNTTVVFTLDGKFTNAADCLTFPIVKNGSAEKDESVPVGTGLFRYDRSDGRRSMTVNPYCRVSSVNISRIDLVQLGDDSTLLHTLELGQIDAYWDDLASGSFSQASTGSAKTNMPNLVYLGLNGSSAMMSSAYVRQAVYYAVNRRALASGAFKGCASPAVTPFHPEWHVLVDSGYDTGALSLDLSRSQELLDTAGVSGNIGLRLIVYTGNNFKVNAANAIAGDLRKLNLRVTVEELTWEDYTAAVTGGNYDLYIGETKLPADMDLAVPYQAGVFYGVNQTDTTLIAYEQLASGKIAMEAFMNAFLQNMPFVPLVYRMGALEYTSVITPAADADYNNCFKNIDQWKLTRPEDQAQ